MILILFSFMPASFGQRNELETIFLAAGFIDIHATDKSIRVDLVNADPSKNFFRKNLYHGQNKAYLQKEVAEKLSKAQKILKSKFQDHYRAPNLRNSLLIPKKDRCTTMHRS